MRERDPRPHTDRGFTLVELMIVLAVTVVGFLALLSLQKGVIQGSTNAWNTSGATQLAQHVLETIRLEALEWYTNNGIAVGGYGQPQFRYLNTLPIPAAGATTGWLPVVFTDGGPTFRQVNQVPQEPARLGQTRSWDTGVTTELPVDRQQRYCVRYRLTWLVPDQLVRAEVRVLWERPERPPTPIPRSYDDCPFPGMEQHPEDVFSLTLPMTVMKNVFVTQ